MLHGLLVLNEKIAWRLFFFTSTLNNCAKKVVARINCRGNSINCQKKKSASHKVKELQMPKLLCVPETLCNQLALADELFGECGITKA